MSRRKPIAALIAGLACLVSVQLARSAVLYDFASDGNAMPGYKGSVTYVATAPVGPNNFHVQVNYGVYEPGKFSLSFPTAADPGDGSYNGANGYYVYAYQMKYLSGNKDATTLSVGYADNLTADQPADIGHIGQASPPIDYGMDPNPSVLNMGPPANPWDTSGQWTFTGFNSSGGGQISEILRYTSKLPPQMFVASLTGSGLSNPQLLPSPIPEPTMGLIAIGVILGAGAGRRKS